MYVFNSIRKSGIYAKNLGIDSNQIMVLTAYDLKHVISIQSTPTNQVGIGERRAEWNLIMPQDFQISVSHNWSEVESQAGKLAQMPGTIANIQSKVDTGKSAESVNDGINAVNKESYAKVDNALIYTSSAKRAYTLSFDLADQGGSGEGEGPFTDVIEPIQYLTELSMPKNDGGVVSFPCVFKVVSKLINLDYAIIESVQADFTSGCYRMGYPVHAKVTLQIKELLPPYRTQNFGEGSKWSSQPIITTHKSL